VTRQESFTATPLTADSPGAYDDIDTTERVAPKKVWQTLEQTGD